MSVVASPVGSSPQKSPVRQGRRGALVGWPLVFASTLDMLSELDRVSKAHDLVARPLDILVLKGLNLTWLTAAFAKFDVRLDLSAVSAELNNGDFNEIRSSRMRSYGVSLDGQDPGSATPSIVDKSAAMLRQRLCTTLNESLVLELFRHASQKDVYLAGATLCPGSESQTKNQVLAYQWTPDRKEINVFSAHVNEHSPLLRVIGIKELVPLPL